MPFFNSEKTLLPAIESVLDQTFSNFELILVNNNSTDSSLAIANNLSKKDSRVKVISESNQGVMYAFDSGAELAQGKFIARMDADDIADKQRIELQEGYLDSHPDVGVVSSSVCYKAHRENTDGFERYVKWSNSILSSREIYLNQFVEFPVVNPTLMWRKEIGEKYGLYKAGEFPEDYEMFLRWMSNGVNYYKLSEKLLIWNDSDERLTRTDEIYSDEAFFKIKTIYLADWLKKNNPCYPEVYIWGASKISRKRAEYLKEYGVGIKAYIDIKETRKLDEEVIYYTHIPNPGKWFILVYLKEETARQKTKDYLMQNGYLEGTNFLMAS